MSARRSSRRTWMSCSRGECALVRWKRRGADGAHARRVFVHRYRDSESLIRVECIKALGGWMKVHPDYYLEGNYLRYIGWVLSDGVRFSLSPSRPRLTPLTCDAAQGRPPRRRQSSHPRLRQRFLHWPSAALYRSVQGATRQDGARRSRPRCTHLGAPRPALYRQAWVARGGAEGCGGAVGV